MSHPSLCRLFLSLGLTAFVAFSSPLEAQQLSRRAKPQSQEAKKEAAVSGPKPQTPPAPPLADVLADAARIDRLVETQLARKNLRPNPPIDDATFVRRIYLDLIGRIPTAAEVTDFLESKGKDKRARLIDRLLASEGYVSHQFNYWADLLRAITRTRGTPTIGIAYTHWIKQSIRQNKPYDRMVYEMLTARGHPADNGAAGYYMRDDGMPLDNMSNTVRVFLGTQIGCAQCHDHPFDSWTQIEFYEMAAYTYGLTYRNRDPKYRQLYRASKRSNVSNNTRQALRRMVRPLRFELGENTRRQLRLPKDYQYKDAKPNALIEPHTLFGEEGQATDSAKRLEAFGRWMTSPQNPRFTKVIANRFWAKAFGIGLIEPVDNIKDNTKASNPELMAFLTERMKKRGYDLRQFQRMLYNTRTYQRASHREDVPAGQAYHFPGPLMRRMSAEQWWDSMLTLTLPDPDQRKGADRLSIQARRSIAVLREDLKSKSTPQIIQQAEQMARHRTQRQQQSAQRRKLFKKMQKARSRGNRKQVAALQEQMRDLNRQARDRMSSMPGQMASMGYGRAFFRETDPRWKSFNRNLVRASELPSPAPAGHFLRQFGQSDRQTIEAANTDPTITQILTLLNGPIYRQMWHRDATLRKAVENAPGPKEKIDAVFLSLYARRPTDREFQLAVSALRDDPKRGMGDLVWALLNTRRFAFIQ